MSGWQGDGSDRVHNVLIVDDDPSIRVALGRLLRLAGHETTELGGAAEVAIHRDCHEVGIFDLELGDGSGLDAARSAVARRIVRRVVFFSGTASHSLIEEAARLGHFISKPDILLLLETVEALLAQAID